LGLGLPSQISDQIGGGIGVGRSVRRSKARRAAPDQQSGQQNAARQNKTPAFQFHDQANPQSEKFSANLQ
jgi:hypothetical protein